MKHADLETCMAISPEFPKSEFVWFGNTVMRKIDIPWHVLERIEEERKICEAAGREFPQRIFNCPSLEDMGEWLHERGGYAVLRFRDQWHLVKLVAPSAKRGKILLTYEILRALRATDETQASAEAVRAIIEQQTKG